ncbi:hypothetical protein DSCA_25420 [Desulfosarcina alkanivorans]|uniref:ChrB C-terminal domain-containing protein n=1 Tax=Desulfosarcina alkanivorans TaxID=571177 RepID=A0A5K7YGB7_9BACT|nr:chromate resistance protein ChrB domain-containing protein [Desulfosarcina alkanivorans]BBO68612.1 hypothetical protein DSCA_25420 [Desulfosarcina alkanivorans]
MEPDRCASAWLIKRFVDIEAQFKFFPDGSLVPEGIPFDTPDATLCRTHHLSTFEIIVQKYRIDDPGIDKLAQAIHSIEIDYWGGERSDLALEIEQALRNIIVQSENNHQCLEKCFQFLDQLLIRIKE